MGTRRDSDRQGAVGCVKLTNGEKIKNVCSNMYYADRMNVYMLVRAGMIVLVN